MSKLTWEDFEFVSNKIAGSTTAPLSPAGALAALLVVEGVLGISDAANAVRVDPADLVTEAQAWAVGAMITPDDES